MPWLPRRQSSWATQLIGHKKSPGIRAEASRSSHTITCQDDRLSTVLLSEVTIHEKARLKPGRLLPGGTLTDRRRCFLSGSRRALKNRVREEPLRASAGAAPQRRPQWKFSHRIRIYRSRNGLMSRPTFLAGFWSLRTCCSLAPLPSLCNWKIRFVNEKAPAVGPGRSCCVPGDSMPGAWRFPQPACEGDDKEKPRPFDRGRNFGRD